MKKIYNKKLFCTGLICLILAIASLFYKEFFAFALFIIIFAIIAFVYFKKKPAVSATEKKYQTASEMLGVPDDLYKNFDINKVKADVSLDEEITINGVKYDRLYLYENQFIVGTKYRDNEVSLFYGDEIILEQEPDNAYDDKAIKVYAIQNGEKIHVGYMAERNPKKYMVYDFLKRGETVLAMVDDEDKPSMTIAFYRKDNS